MNFGSIFSARSTVRALRSRFGIINDIGGNSGIGGGGVGDGFETPVVEVDEFADEIQLLDIFGEVV